MLIDCRDDKTGRAYQPGDVVTTEDFPQGVISAWLRSDPPVLALIEEDSD